MARASLLANRIGYLFFAVAVAVFIIGFAVGFTGAIVAVVVTALVVGSLLLAAVVFQLIAWGFLAVYLLWRSGFGPREIGLGRIRWKPDILGGLGLAALIGLPGLGGMLRRSIIQHDLPLTAGIVIFVALAIGLLNLVVDLAYAALDPRARLSRLSLQRA